MKEYPLLIGGKPISTDKWIYTLYAKAFLNKARDAFTLKRQLELGKVQATSEDIVARSSFDEGDANMKAVEAAFAAWKVFRKTSLNARLAMVRAFRNKVEEKREEFREVLIAEGHPHTLARWEIDGLVQGSCEETLDYLARQLHYEQQTPRHKILLQRKSDGVVCINPPQNAAASNSALGVYALLAGNALVVKAPRSCPYGVMYLYQEIIWPAFKQLGAPDGLINLVCGRSQKITQEWLQHPLVRDILFFGDSHVGIDFGKQCIAQNKKPILELSGNDGFVVWHDADLEQASSVLCESFYGSGQICMVPKYAIVHPQIAAALIEIFCRKAKDIVPKPPHDPDAILSPVLKMAQYFEFLAQAKAQGAQVLMGGQRLDINNKLDASGLFLQPTALHIEGFDRAKRMQCVQEETFFPLLPIIVPKSAPEPILLEQILGHVNENQYGLRNSLWCSDQRVIEQFKTEIYNAGQLKVNTSHIGFSPYLSTHGGTGLTGGPFGELNYVTLRTSHLHGVAEANPL